jgi:hypothetical protein
MLSSFSGLSNTAMKTPCQKQNPKKCTIKKGIKKIPKQPFLSFPFLITTIIFNKLKIPMARFSVQKINIKSNVLQPKIRASKREVKFRKISEISGKLLT